MNQSAFADHPRVSKTFIACLIISLMILSPLAPLVQGAPKFSKRVETASVDPAAAFDPSITATKTDSFPDPDNDDKAAPGETITYDVNITNSGPDDATGVSFLDTIDPNTTLVGGSLKVSPLAFPDVFAAAKDTPLVVGAPGVLNNDTGLPAPTAVPIAGGATSQGGTVTLNADGSFTYTPPAGFEGNDSFTYTATNGLTPNDTALVTLNVDAAPSVVSTTPTNGATEQAQNTDITITFSEAVNVTGEWFQISCTESGVHAFADVDVSGGPTTFTLNPDTDFAPTETCTVTVLAAQVTDQDLTDPPDQMAANFVFSFTTSELELAPTVSNTTPANGAVDQATNTDITVTFSESVNVTGNWFQIVCTTSGTRNVADTAVTPASPSTTFTINPNTDFAPGEGCTVTIVAAQVTDADTNDPPDNMTADFVFNFTTDVAPAVTATTPTNGATQVPNNTNISITFNEAVDVTGNWFQIVGATSGTRNVADTTVTGGPTTFDINPADFANGELVTVTVFAAQVSDQDTNDPPQNLAANFVFSFTIDQAPSVTSTAPTNGATQQALNSNITINFSEAVNVTGNWFQISCATSGTRNVGDTAVSGGPTAFTINPTNDFAPNELCTVTIFAAQVSDQDSGDPPDNMDANFVFSFTTIDLAPTVTATTPTNGATNQITNTDITVTFSESVNVTGNWFTIVCTTSGTKNVADTAVTPASPSTAFTINPTTDFAPGETCTVTIVATQVTDADTNDPPNNMAANFVFSFSTDAAPTVNATTPANGATQVANNTNISITFSEPVDVTGNWFQIVGATSGTRNVADTNVTGGPTTFNIDPSDFANGELVTVTVFAAQVADQDSNDPPQNMLSNFVFSFTIDQAPSVTTTNPNNNVIDVLKGSNIVINFSENVNATGSSFSIECPAPGNLQPFAVTGSGTNQITLNPTGDLPPGVICTVTVIANQISDTDAGDPPDNMLANFVFSFGVKPEAVDDARNATGNIRIQTAGRSGFTVLTNDLGPKIGPTALAVTAFDAISLRGGNVAIGADGTFTYNPPAGYEGADSFNYTIANNAGSDVGTVNITIAGMIWFVNVSAGGCTTINGSCGRLTNPFSTLNAFEAANGNATPVVNGDVTSPEAGDHLFIHNGTYNSSLTLENNQRVIGQGSTSSLQTHSGITPATDSDSLPATGGANPIITNNAGAGITTAQGNRLHGLTVQNTTGTGISGNNFGTLTISENMIVSNTTTGGTAVSFNNGTLAATFRSISAGNNDGNPDPANGIVLTTTTGSFTVEGDGTNTSVGGNASGGTIQNMVGADGANGGNAVFMNSATNVTLRRMTISGTNQNHGIRGINVTGFTLEFSTVTGSNGTSAALDEGAVNFDNLLGTAAITSCVLEGGFEENLNVVNSSGTLNRLIVSGTTFGFNGTPNGNHNILINAENAGTTLNYTLKSSLIKGARADFLSTTANASSTMDIVIGGPLVADGNTFDNLGANAHPNQLGGGNRLVVNSVGNQTVDIRNNTLKGSKGEAIRVRGTATGAITGLTNARVRNNTIGVAGTANSGSSEGFGIFIFGDGGSDMNVAVTDNSVFQYNNSGINLQTGDEINNGSVYNFTVTGNTVNSPGTVNTDFSAIHLDNGQVLATDNYTTCADIGGAGALANNVVGGGKGSVPPNNAEIRVRQRQVTTVRLPGYAGPNNNNPQVEAYLDGRNNVNSQAAANTVASGGGGFIGGAACTQPTVVASAQPAVITHRDQFAQASEPAKPAVKIENGPSVSKADKPVLVSSKPSVAQTFSHHAKVAKRDVGQQQVNAMQDKKPRRGITIRPRVSILSGETVSHSIGTLRAGKTVRIQFQVTVNSPYGGGEFVSNQGTVSGTNFTDVLTDDPAAGGANDPTTTPILLTPNVSVADAQANEPASGSVPMLFTVSLSAPAGASGASVQYETADQFAAPEHAVAGVDYTAVPLTTLNFGPGEQFKTVSVNILADGAGSEIDETFLLNLSNPVNALIADGSAVGTIKQGNAAGTFLISEIRTSGPGGAGDDFVEVFNNSDAPLTIAASDASAGYGLFKMGADCSATPVLIGTIPNGTVIPARGHYLFVGSAYSLSNYGGTEASIGNLTLSEDIESDANVGIFNTSFVANLSSVTRLDAVGFGSNTGGNCDLLREGTTLPPLAGSTLEHSYVRDECGKKGNPAIFGLCPSGFLVVDTNVNNDDFIFVDTTAAVTVAGQRLGAPGPQNLASPLLRNSTITTLFLDTNFGGPAPPNRVRNLTPVTNGANGTMSVRRRFVNNTGGPVTRLRFRIVDISSISVPGGIADVRALTSADVVVSGITDTATCAAAGTTPPCSVTVLGTTLEQPPTQALGGAHNSTMTAGTITLATPLAPGASINLQFLLGVQQTGAFKFFFNIEALP